MFVEYAKASPEDMLIRITVHNRGPDAATLHVLPTLWFRNTWSWRRTREPPLLRQIAAARAAESCSATIASSASDISTARATPTLLFTENETNTQRLSVRRTAPRT